VSRASSAAIADAVAARHRRRTDSDGFLSGAVLLALRSFSSRDAPVDDRRE
jgi:hypothetical protein